MHTQPKGARRSSTFCYLCAAQASTSGTWVIATADRGMDRVRANSAWLMMTFPAAVTMRDVDNVFFGGHVEQRYFEEDDSGVLEVKGGVLQLQDDALSVLAAESPCALLSEMVAGANADDVLDICLVQ